MSCVFELLFERKGTFLSIIPEIFSSPSLYFDFLLLIVMIEY